MKKIYASLAIIVGFSLYAGVVQRTGSTSQQLASAVQPAVVATASQVAHAAQAPSPAAPAQTPAPTPAPAQPAVAVTEPVAAATVKKGKYADGTYTGAAADAFYGQVQVQVTITGGRIASISFLQYPQDRSTSRDINQSAMNGLVSQAIANQGASVSGVSGATDTTAAFRQSLSSALSQAA